MGHVDEFVLEVGEEETEETNTIIQRNRQKIKELGFIFILLLQKQTNRFRLKIKIQETINGEKSRIYPSLSQMVPRNKNGW